MVNESENGASYPSTLAAATSLEQKKQHALHAANDEGKDGGVKHGEEKHGGPTSQSGSPMRTTDQVGDRGLTAAKAGI